MPNSNAMNNDVTISKLHKTLPEKLITRYSAFNQFNSMYITIKKNCYENSRWTVDSLRLLVASTRVALDFLDAIIAYSRFCEIHTRATASCFQMDNDIVTARHKDPQSRWKNPPSSQVHPPGANQANRTNSTNRVNRPKRVKATAHNYSKL